MAKKLYIGVDGVAQEAKEIYIGVNGIAKKVIKGYVGDENNIARLFWENEKSYLIGKHESSPYIIYCPLTEYYIPTPEISLDIYGGENWNVCHRASKTQFGSVCTDGSILLTLQKRHDGVIFIFFLSEFPFYVVDSYDGGKNWSSSNSSSVVTLNNKTYYYLAGNSISVGYNYKESWYKTNEQPDYDNNQQFFWELAYIAFDGTLS